VFQKNNIFGVSPATNQ